MMQPDGLIGQQLGDYRIEARIGRGGMAKIYRAYQPSVQRYVAVKLISTELAEDQDFQIFRERFAREAKVIASLEHTHILPIYDYGIVEDTAYLVMRLLDGGSLSDQIADGPMALERVGDIFSQIARGLAYAHSKGIIHRDLKPANILFASTGDAYLTDFGLAKWVEGSPVLTQSGKIVGTPAYMSPEQLRGETIDQRADVYSMSVILYQMVTGELPFDSDSGDVISIIYQHLEKDPPPPHQLNPQVPPAVEAVILRGLQKNPNQRYSSILQMADELDRALGRRSGSTGDLMAPTPPVLRTDALIQAQRRSRRRLVTASALIAAVALIVLITLLVIRTQISPVPKPTVEAGAEASALSIVPSSDEIATAQRVLGDGFIAYVTCNQTSEYHATQSREMGDFARVYGLAYRVYDSNTDPYNQLTQIERARADKARALIICPLDAALLDEPLKSVQAAGIPLVLLSADMASYGGVLITGDEYQMGFKAGQMAGQLITQELGGQGRFVILDYPDLPQLVVRADGLEAGVLSEAPNATLVGRYRGATPEFGKASISQLIAEGVQFDVIVSINDAGAFGAIQAMEAADITPDQVMITSIDAEQLARRYIREGYYLRGSMDVGREKFSRAAIDAVTKLLAGSQLPELVLAPPGEMMTAETLTATQSDTAGRKPD
ncbi:MAG: protein kinase [Anaerolineae bacterium]|nr:protein kinase [Anaerolineae bacterium]